MVLCSVLVHGLSIPSFLFGRRVTTVTRTLSRQPSLSLPDWALHTRRIERVEDVVINHDPVSMMERGQISDNAIKRHPSEIMSFDEDEKDPGALRRVDTSDADALTAVAVTDPEEAKPDNPPDGMESYEWKEGACRVIDWRTGPGEDVRLPFLGCLVFCSRMTHLL